MTLLDANQEHDTAGRPAIDTQPGRDPDRGGPDEARGSEDTGRSESHDPERREQPERSLHARPGEPAIPRAFRIRRVRLWGVVKIGAVFSLLGYVVTLTTVAVVWNVVLRLGFVDDGEDLLESALGVETFDVVGRDLFDVLAVAAGVLFAIILVTIVLLAMVYNAACTVFGGVTLEAAPVRSPRLSVRIMRRIRRRLRADRST